MFYFQLTTTKLLCILLLVGWVLSVINIKPENPEVMPNLASCHQGKPCMIRFNLILPKPKFFRSKWNIIGAYITHIHQNDVGFPLKVMMGSKCIIRGSVGQCQVIYFFYSDISRISKSDRDAGYLMTVTLGRRGGNEYLKIPYLLFFFFGSKENEVQYWQMNQK